MERESKMIMGMPVALEVIDPSATQATYEAVFAYLVSVDECFSTYKEDSEISRINRGEIAPDAYSREMQEVFRLARETEEATSGYFTIHTPTGVIDPSGLVKGWAIQKAAELLHKEGCSNFYLEIAGDIQTSGLNSEGKEWSIGIRNPFALDEIVKVIFPKGNGVATSGTYLQGTHIYNPHTKDAPAHFVSLTVIGPNVYEADRFATAAFAMEERGMQFLESLSGFEAYAIDTQKNAVMTSGFESFTKI